jgi:hypothetical protein
MHPGFWEQILMHPGLWVQILMQLGFWRQAKKINEIMPSPDKSFCVGL